MPTVRRAAPDELPTVLGLVGELLGELADDPAEFAGVDLSVVAPTLHQAGTRFAAYLAADGDDSAAGVVTLTEACAAYAGGFYGIISELYVRPGFRGRRIGAALLEAARDHGRARQWRRLDVTAPPGARWAGTVAFYERNGFVFTGPKLRCALEPSRLASTGA